MKLIIHRGTNEIGGSCVEFNNGCKRIVFDVGLPLNAIDEGLDISCYKPNISGLFGEESGVAAIFISHAHPDHYGLLSLINKNIPIYMSKASAILLKKVVPLLGKENYADLNIKEISDGEEVRIGDFIVRAYVTIALQPRWLLKFRGRISGFFIPEIFVFMVGGHGGAENLRVI